MNPRPVRDYTETLNPQASLKIDSHGRDSWSTQNGSIIAYLTVSLLFLYYFFTYLHVPFTIPQALWNILVQFTPSRIVLALDSNSRSSEKTESMAFASFQAKSDAMQRILGLDKTSIYSFFPRARGLSGLGNALLGAKEPVPPGLGNWDNSCYQNSVIQGLASLHAFETFLDRNLQNLAERGSLSTHAALKDIIERLNDPSCHGQKLWIPTELKSMSSWQQQDAQEYFSKIVDQLDKEILQASKGLTTNLGLKLAGPREHVLGTALDSPHPSPLVKVMEHPESFQNPLEGLLAQRVGCMGCGWSDGLTLIPFNCLTVSLGKGSEYDIRDCLDDYMNLEPIEGVECAKCTLLRTKDQLTHLLKQIDEDEELEKTTEVPKLSDALRTSAIDRLKAVQDALDEEEFSEKTLSKKCHIPSKNRVSTMKSRQAVIARTPDCLVIHVNRSVFDENTGLLRKNYANVRFPKVIDLDEWCLGSKENEKGSDSLERWYSDPRRSMLPQPGRGAEVMDRKYELRAVLTHYGRHENGHYIAYRKYSISDFPAEVPELVFEADGNKEKDERWFRLSDEDVQMVSERSVFTQGGVFMLFYERLQDQVRDDDIFDDAKSELDEKVRQPTDTFHGVVPLDASSKQEINTNLVLDREASSNGSDLLDSETSQDSPPSNTSLSDFVPASAQSFKQNTITDSPPTPAASVTAG